MRIFLLLVLTHLLLYKATAQSLNGKLTVYTQIDSNIKKLSLEAFGTAESPPLFVDSISNNSITQIVISDTIASKWIRLKFAYSKDSVSWTSAFYIKGNEKVEVYFKSFFNPPLVAGGENEFINENRYLYLDVPFSLTKGAEYNPKTLRKAYRFVPRSGFTWSRYMEFEQSVIKKLKAHSDFDYVLELLNNNRSMFPLHLIDSCLSLFSDRIKSGTPWQNLRKYTQNEKEVIEKGISLSIPILESSGKETQLGEILSGHEYSFIDFWASWCVPCKQQMPELKQIFSKVESERIQFVSVAIDEQTLDDWTGADKIQKFPWRSLLDKKNLFRNTLNIEYIPQGIILDKNGRIIERYLTLDDLRAFLEKQKLWKNK